jgi:hypothetical protein
MLVLSLASDQVQLMLPAELELAPQDITPQGKHPLIFMFGHQMEVEIHLGPEEFFHLDYLEFVLEVPFTQWKETTANYRGPFLFSPRLFLNQTFPIILGQLYGLAKKKASMAMNQRRYIIDDLDTNELIISGDFTLKGQPGPTSAFPLFGEAIPKMLNQPLVGQTPLGPFVCSIFEWNLAQAQVQALEAKVQIAQSFVPGLSNGKYSVRGIDQTRLGAFRLNTNWSMSEPMACFEITSNLIEQAYLPA